MLITFGVRHLCRKLVGSVGWLRWDCSFGGANKYCVRFAGSQRLGWLMLFFALSLVPLLILLLVLRTSEKEKKENYENHTTTRRAPAHASKGWRSIRNHGGHLACARPKRIRHS